MNIQPAKIADAPRVIRLHADDNVAIVVNDFGLPAGTVLPDGLQLRDHVPQGHKVALTDIKAGDTVWKYGQDIGKAVANIAKGDHVHVHNLKTKRW